MTYFKEWLREATNPRHLLLVDDSPQDCEIILRGSEDYLIAWTVAHTFKEAVDALESPKDFRLVILDLQLSGSIDPAGGALGGVALFREIKRRWPWIPVLVLSGHLDQDAIDEMTRIGFVMFMRKPSAYDVRFFGELYYAFNIPKKSVSLMGSAAETKKQNAYII